jgi:hypothetical protein
MLRGSISSTREVKYRVDDQTLVALVQWPAWAVLRLSGYSHLRWGFGASPIRVFDITLDTFASTIHDALAFRYPTLSHPHKCGRKLTSASPTLQFLLGKMSTRGKSPQSPWLRDYARVVQRTSRTPKANKPDRRYRGVKRDKKLPSRIDVGS